MNPDLAAQVKAVRTAAGFLDRSDRGKLLVTGADRQPFLHNMLSNAVLGLKPGQGCRTELLDEKGHIVADMRLYAGADDLLIDLEPGSQETVRAILDKYVIMDDVTFEDATDRMALYTVSGISAAGVLEAAGLAGAPEGPYAHGRGSLAGADVRIARTRWTGSVDFDLYVERSRAAAVEDALTNAVTGAGGSRISREAFEILRVEAGVPRQGADLDGVIPLEALLEKDDEAVSLTKGCYLGQETLARIDARGHVNRLLVGLKFEGREPPEPGAKLRAAGKEVGRITSAVTSPTLDAALALGYIRREHAQPGTAVTVVTPSGELGASVAALPFVH